MVKGNTFGSKKKAPNPCHMTNLKTNFPDEIRTLTTPYYK